MNNWDDLKLMLALSRYGTMSSAAKSLNLSTATVSRRLERCAEDVGQTLFVRRGQTWEPTPAAFVFIGLAEAVTDGFQNDKQLSVPDQFRARTLRTSMPLDICMDVLAPSIPQFLNDNPGLTMDTFHEAKSIAFGEVDIRLSYEEPMEGRLVRLRLGAVGFRTYVKKDHKVPPQGWVEILNFERANTTMGDLLQDQFGPPRLKTTSITCAINLAQEMPLIVILPTRLARRYSDLIPQEPETPIRYFPVWAAYHESRRLDPDVRLSLSFIKECFDA
ncbi:MAG: DNA-binding transcriptional LysR family regulator [Ascidiaceihabitans sp.]